MRRALLLGLGLGLLSFQDAWATYNGHFVATATSQHNLNSTGFTVETWVRVAGTPGDNPYIVHGRRFAGTNDSEIWQLSICKTACTSGRVAFSARSAGVNRFYVVSTTSIQDGQWHHVAGTYDGTTARIYVDGVLENSQAYSSVNVNVAGGNLYLGAGGPTRDQLFGFIDEVRLWSVARTGTQIANNRNAEIASQATLVACWRLNGNGNDLQSTATFAPVGGAGFVIGGQIGQGASVGIIVDYPGISPLGTLLVALGCLVFGGWFLSQRRRSTIKV